MDLRYGAMPDDSNLRAVLYAPSSWQADWDAKA